MVSDNPLPARRRRGAPTVGPLTLGEWSLIVVIMAILTSVATAAFRSDDGIRMPNQCKGCISCSFNSDGTVTKTGCR